MSRIGKMPVSIPKGVTVDLKDDKIKIKGPKGQLDRTIHPMVNVSVQNDQIIVAVGDESKESKSLHGLFRALISNMVTGVSQGFQRELEIVGVGYRAEISGKTATFNLGYSHPIVFELPDGIEGSIDRNKISLQGIDRDLLGKTAAKIRGFRKPEPYKGKGIRYVDEYIKRKAGKTGAK